MAPVQSQHLVDRIWEESFWLGCPDFADVVVRRERLERIEPVGEGLARLMIVVVVVEPFHGRVLDCPVHLRDLTAIRENSQVKPFVGTTVDWTVV